MIRLGWRNLWQHRGRLIIAIGGVGLALSLILGLDAVLKGMEGQISLYIERAGADVWVSQAGVRNLHMVTSTLPASTTAEVASVPGVDAVTPILYVSYPVQSGGASRLAYVIGQPIGASMGGPWELKTGTTITAPGHVVLGTGLAQALGVGLNDAVKIFGQDFRIVGLTRQPESMGTSVVFIGLDDFARYRRSQNAVSFVLAQLDPMVPPTVGAERIEAAVEGVTATPRSAFAASEQRVVKDMGADVVSLMNVIGFAVGLTSMALVIYLATYARRAEFGVLKALGAGRGHLTQVVLAQAFISVGLGLALAVVITSMLALLLPRFGSQVTLTITLEGLLKTGVTSLTIAALAALLPVWQIRKLDPARVFKGGVR